MQGLKYHSICYQELLGQKKWLTWEIYLQFQLKTVSQEAGFSRPAHGTIIVTVLLFKVWIPINAYFSMVENHGCPKKSCPVCHRDITKCNLILTCTHPFTHLVISPTWWLLMWYIAAFQVIPSFITETSEKTCTEMRKYANMKCISFTTGMHHLRQCSVAVMSALPCCKILRSSPRAAVLFWSQIWA